MLTLRDYLNKYPFFQVMHLPDMEADTAKILDEMFKNLYGSRILAPLIGGYINKTTNDLYDVDENPTTIAFSVYLLNQQKWDSLIEFNKNAENSLYNSKTTKTTTYGHVVTGQDSGSDSNSGSTGLYGFDSIESIDADVDQRTYVYGKGNEVKNSGEDVEVTESRNELPSQLAESNLDFWRRNELIKVLLHDSAKSTTLSIYQL